MIGQSYIDSEVKASLERYDVRRDSRISREAANKRQAYRNPSRNLDYVTADQPLVINSLPSVSRTQVSQATAYKARNDFASRHDIRQEAIDAARKDYEIEKERLVQAKRQKKDRRRSEVVNEALEDARFKASIDYAYLFGEQSFRIINSDGSKLSKLTYPLKGGMTIANMEYKITPKIFVGGRWMSSHFKNKTSKDEDWNIWVNGFGPASYHVTEHDSKNNAKYFDTNVYYRVADFDRATLGDYLSDFLIVDRLYIDIFGGYQYYKATHISQDPITRHELQDLAGGWWFTPTPYSDGLDSKYEVEYKGPRVGLRVGGSITEKISSNISFSYAWLKTQSSGNWNLRNFNWWHKGNGLGKSFIIDAEGLYHITPNWFVGAGFHYMYQEQKDLLYTGVQPGGFFKDLDQSRDTKMHLFGPSVKLGMRW